MIDHRPVSAEAQLQAMCDESPFIAAMQLRVMHVARDQNKVRFRIPFQASHERIRASGQWQGGVIAALIDSAACMGIVACSERLASTVDLRIDYLKPATGPFLDAVAHNRKLGRNLGCADADVFDKDGKLVAIGRGQFFMEASGQLQWIPRRPISGRC